MGDERFPLDPQLRVRGVEGLRVIDASVDAQDQQRQHQRADDHDRREGRRDGAGGREGGGGGSQLEHDCVRRAGAEHRNREARHAAGEPTGPTTRLLTISTSSLELQHAAHAGAERRLEPRQGDLGRQRQLLAGEGEALVGEFAIEQLRLVAPSASARAPSIATSRSICSSARRRLPASTATCSRACANPLARTNCRSARPLGSGRNKECAARRRRIADPHVISRRPLHERGLGDGATREFAFRPNGRGSGRAAGRDRIRRVGDGLE